MSTVACVIRLLGEPSCIVDNVARRVGGPPRTLVLLLFLALHPGEPLDRRRIAFILWPDDDAETALANLRRHLHRLSATLPARAGGCPWFETSRVSVRWNGGIEVDIAAFEEALNRGDEAAAIAVYRGPLCAGVEEEWADRERERLERLALDALDRLVERDRTRDAQRAIDWANRALAIDPWRESALRALIELQSAVGDAASARRTYEEFAQRLMHEIGAAPAPETTEAYERIARRPPPRPRGNLPQHMPPIVGRKRDLADVCDLIRTEHLVTLVGYGGIGKTRIAIAAGQAFADDFADGVHVCELVSIAQSWWRRRSHQPPALRKPKAATSPRRSASTLATGSSSSTIASICSTKHRASST
jgi:DNA-binding SARP family transcriptional activator